MGAIGEEELMKWEKMHGVMDGDGGEERILVLVRLRPLDDKEIARNEVSDWECINDTTILYRNSLQERSGFPTAYSYDRVFRGDSPTRQVFEEGAKEIALSVLTGINSTIFAYGQTSSGKTYTMNGITKYTVAEIYDYIQRHEERAFVLKFSAIEIYNEVVRDLLSIENTPLRLLDDPEKGIIVEKLREENLRDWSHLKELLSICEAQRQIGETSLNETSSRSHQILRLTIESSAREFVGKEKSTTLAASVNFVDLAGSERASQALSVGQRLKEGCHINRSLLTLGTVIRKLSKGRHGHINYRDSKLTRILQPSLGGNARTAIICTLSPARSHVEQSRNTLLFASCAKEVTTNAQVNVFMSDKALVKHLQKEVARLEGELRTPGPTCDYPALLRKKDQQMEKLEKEVRDLIKQRDLSQSRIEDLLRVVENDQASRQRDGLRDNPKQRKKNAWEDECSVSESLGGTDPHYLDTGVRKFSAPHSSKRENTIDVTSTLSSRSKFGAFGPFQGREEFSLGTGDDSDVICKEVRCIEIDKSSKAKTPESSFVLFNGENDRRMLTPIVSRNEVSNRPMEGSNIKNGFNYGVFEREIQDAQKTIESLVSPYPDERFPWAVAKDMSSSRSMKLTRSRSCGANVMAGSSLSDSEETPPSEKTPPNGFENNFPKNEKTPPNGFENNFPVRAEDFSRKHWKLRPLKFGSSSKGLSRNDSQSSIGSGFIDELKAQNNTVSRDEDIPSIDTFVAGLKELAQLQYENQFVDDQVQEMEPKATKLEKSVKDVGLDPMQDSSGTPLNWTLEYEKLQRSILELWQTCNVSLVHRTYFFLLFKGDPTDSIYMEVEFRRLSFLKETFSKGHPAVQDGRSLTLDSSKKSLRREREMLSRLMYKTFSEEERNRIYQKWDISLDSKQRRLELVRRLWSDTKDINHITESAAIVAKLIRFSEQGQALKEMFELSFTPPSMSRRSFSWRRSRTSLL